MLIWVLRQNLDVVGVIDDMISLITVRKFRTPGNFELNLPSTEQNKRLIKPNHYISRGYDVTIPPLWELWYIESIKEINNGVETTLVVAGYSAEGILRKRVFPFWLPQYPNSEDGMALSKLTTLNKFFDVILDLGCEIVYTGPEFDTTNLPTECRAQNMEEFVQYIITRTENSHWIYHLNLEYVGSEKHLKLWFEEIEAIDSFPPRTILSEDTDNFVNTTYSMSEADCFNRVFFKINLDFSIQVEQPVIDDELSTPGNVVYEKDEHGNDKYETRTLTLGDIQYASLPEVVVDINEDALKLGYNEKIVLVDPVLTYSERRVDFQAKQYVRQNETIGNMQITSEGKFVYKQAHIIELVWTIDQDATIKFMNDQAAQMMINYTENITGTVVEVDEPLRNAGIMLGSIVLIRDNSRRVDFFKRIEEIEETWDSSGYNMTPTFGEPLKTIYDYIDDRTKQR